MSNIKCIDCQHMAYSDEHNANIHKAVTQEEHKNTRFGACTVNLLKRPPTMNMNTGGIDLAINKKGIDVKDVDMERECADYKAR